jgi:hypothetical protein
MPRVFVWSRFRDEVGDLPRGGQVTQCEGLRFVVRPIPVGGGRGEREVGSGVRLEEERRACLGGQVRDVDVYWNRARLAPHDENRNTGERRTIRPVGVHGIE